MKRGRDLLAEYLASEFVQTARYDESSKRYRFQVGGVVHEAGGLLSMLRDRHYPHYVEGAVPQKRFSIAGKPSTALQGIRIDDDMMRLVQTGRPEDLHPMSRALLRHWQVKGHTVVAAQVPVRVAEHRMTKADVLTRDDKTQKLWMWEVKSGMCAALQCKQGEMQNIPASSADGGGIPCTKAGQWQLQCEYTRRALVAAGLPIKGARVIQVYESRKGRGVICIKEHRTASWLKQLAPQ